MQAVLIAAGRGKRMMPLTAHAPKPLLKYKGRPLIEWALLNLPDEIDEVVIVVGYLGDQIREFVGDEWNGRAITYVKQDKLDGTGGALLRCQPLLKEKFLVMYGDDLFDQKVLTSMLAYDRAILACRREVDKRVRTLQIDEKGKLVGIREARPDESEAIIFTGSCVLDREIFEEPFVPLPSAPEELSLPDTILSLTRRAPVHVVMADSWVSISEPKDLNEK